MNVLPDKLSRGDKLRSSSGSIYTVSTTTKKDSFGEPLVKLVNAKGKISDTLWSRDALQEAGAVYVEPVDPLSILRNLFGMT